MFSVKCCFLEKLKSCIYAYEPDGFFIAWIMACYMLIYTTDTRNMHGFWPLFVLWMRSVAALRNIRFRCTNFYGLTKTISPVLAPGLFRGGGGKSLRGRGWRGKR